MRAIIIPINITDVFIPKERLQRIMEKRDDVAKETRLIGLGTLAGTAVMLVGFAVLHLALPEQIPFGISEIVSGLLGCAVAVANFYFMGRTVRRVVNCEREDDARRIMTLSYRNRLLMQLVWAILSMAVPFLNPAAGIIPLFIPSLLIKARGVRSGLDFSGSAAASSGDTSGDTATDAADSADSNAADDTSNDADADEKTN